MKKTTAFLALLLMLGSLAGCQSESTAAPELLEPVGVKMDSAVAQYGDIYNISVYSGEIVPYVEELHFLVDGQLSEIKVSYGDFVEEGQVLATLDDEALREQIAELEANIAYAEKTGDYSDRQAEIDVEIAKLELRGLEEEPETETKTIRAKELEIEQLEAARAQAQELRQLEYEKQVSELAALREDLKSVNITAPFSGQVVYIADYEPGSSVISYTPVFCIADESRLHIVSDFIEERAVQNADQVYAQVLDRKYPISYIPMELDVYLSKIISGAEMETQFSIDEGAEQLKSGQYAAVTMIDSYKENVLLVPANAIYRDEKGRYVYKIIDNERVRQDVTVGYTTDIEAEIIEGLQEGDVVYVKE